MWETIYWKIGIEKETLFVFCLLVIKLIMRSLWREERNASGGSNNRFIVKSNFSSWLCASFVPGAMLSSWTLYFRLHFVLHLEVSMSHITNRKVRVLEVNEPFTWLTSDKSEPAFYCWNIWKLLQLFYMLIDLKLPRVSYDLPREGTKHIYICTPAAKEIFVIVLVK